LEILWGAIEVYIQRVVFRFAEPFDEVTPMAPVQDVITEAPILHVAFELSSVSWILASGVRSSRTVRRRSVKAGALKEVLDEIATAKGRFDLPQDARVVTCYEAGRDGFWLHRWLLDRGIENLVVDPASIDVNRRARRAKTDRLDADKLLERLRRYTRGEEEVWSVVRVPELEVEDLRRLQREVDRLKLERTQHSVRIRSILATHGLGHLCAAEGVHSLKGLHPPAGYDLGKYTLLEIQMISDRMDLAAKQLKEVEKIRRELERGPADLKSVRSVLLLLALRGIGEEGAWAVGTELFGWRKFHNRREVGAITGLVGAPYDTGKKDHEQGITKAGRSSLRRLLVELAWLWVRLQPKSALSQWFERRFGEGSKRCRRVGIVAVARKLVVALWRWVEFGELPEGAELSRSMAPEVLKAVGKGWEVPKGRDVVAATG
jgi:transposase